MFLLSCLLFLGFAFPSVTQPGVEGMVTLRVAGRPRRGKASTFPVGAYLDRGRQESWGSDGFLHRGRVSGGGGGGGSR